ncbi:transposase [Bacillus thuringiensis]|nr:transposase [Bacillus thuringiensis]
MFYVIHWKGNTIDFHLSKTREEKAAKHFFKKALQSFHVSKPRVITVKKNSLSYSNGTVEKKIIPVGMRLRQQKYLNNIVEQDYRFIKKQIRSMLGFKCLYTAKSILSGVEAIHMIKKEQADLRDQSVQNQKEFIHQLFGLAA